MVYQLKTIKTGFTLVEIMIVIGIGAILTAAAVPAFGNIQTGSQLNDQTLRLTQTIRMAREKALSGAGASNHGVYFDLSDEASDRYVLYQGLSYGQRNSAFDREEILPPALDISSDISGFDINFSQGSGLPGASGQIEISAEYYGRKTLSVNRLGFVREE